MLKIIKKTMPNGAEVTFNEYCDTANYGTSIDYLRAVGWQGDGKYKHLAEVFGITEDEAREEYAKWRGYDQIKTKNKNK